MLLAILLCLITSCGVDKYEEGERYIPTETEGGKMVYKSFRWEVVVVNDSTTILIPTIHELSSSQPIVVNTKRQTITNYIKQ